MELSSRLGEESMKKSSGKFDDLARQRVIDAVHKHFDDVTLTPVEKRRKWLQDGLGRNWWVLGGKRDESGRNKKNRCGIPKVMMENEEQAHIAGREGMLVIAQLIKGGVIEAFYGRLGPLVKAKNKFPRSPQGNEDQYQFTVRPCGDCLRIDKINVELKRFASIPYSDEKG